MGLDLVAFVRDGAEADSTAGDLLAESSAEGFDEERSARVDFFPLAGAAFSFPTGEGAVAAGLESGSQSSSMR